MDTIPATNIPNATSPRHTTFVTLNIHHVFLDEPPRHPELVSGSAFRESRFRIKSGMTGKNVPRFRIKSG